MSREKNGAMTGDNDRLLSIEEISRETGLEESVLRFYESEFGAELPDKILHGDVLSFPAAAVDAFRQIHARQTAAIAAPPKLAAAGPFARVIAVTSGKGGVGKTNLALNLAIELRQLGKLCLVLDADMGMANVHLLAGVNPTLSLMDVLNDHVAISDIIIEGPAGIGLIPGGSGLVALADASRPERMKIVRALEEVEVAAEIILVDTGAGMGAGVRDFLVAADDILFVLTPDITSLADSYGLLKTLRQERDFTGRSVYSVINMVHSLTEAADVAQRFAACARRFLDQEVENLGYIMKDATVGGATVRRTPYCIFRPQARVSINTRNVAKAILKREQPEIRLSSSFGRFLERVQGKL
jgi:flagellar biosynthesis protein FlhG